MSLGSHLLPVLLKCWSVKIRFLPVHGEFLCENDAITREPARDNFQISIFAVPTPMLKIVVHPGVSKMFLFSPVLSVSIGSIFLEKGDMLPGRAFCRC